MTTFGPSALHLQIWPFQRSCFTCRLQSATDPSLGAFWRSLWPCGWQTWSCWPCFRPWLSKAWSGHSWPSWEAGSTQRILSCFLPWCACRNQRCIDTTVVRQSWLDNTSTDMRRIENLGWCWSREQGKSQHLKSVEQSAEWLLHSKSPLQKTLLPLV